MRLKCPKILWKRTKMSLVNCTRTHTKWILHIDFQRMHTFLLVNIFDWDLVILSFFFALHCLLVYTSDDNALLYICRKDEFFLCVVYSVVCLGLFLDLTIRYFDCASLTESGQAQQHTQTLLQCCLWFSSGALYVCCSLHTLGILSVYGCVLLIFSWLLILSNFKVRSENRIDDDDGAILKTLWNRCGEHSELKCVKKNQICLLFSFQLMKKIQNDICGFL